ncbi:hypothetical protein Ac2012v2_004660 [Leucoagaricus gongylophorus]
MADQDTDRWVFEVLAPDLRRQMKNLKDKIQWTDLVAQSLREAHSRGITREQIENSLRIMPFVSSIPAPLLLPFEKKQLNSPPLPPSRQKKKHPAMIRAVTNLNSRGKTTFLCLSNSNSIFISTILNSKSFETQQQQQQPLSTLFTEIITNPATWQDDLLVLDRRIHSSSPHQHNCQIGCSPNMCKGEELTAFLDRHGQDFDRIIYVGDGSNDFCPILRLRDQDTVFCRVKRGLSERIEKEAEKEGLKCQIQYWAGAWEIEEMFDKL